MKDTNNSMEKNDFSITSDELKSKLDSNAPLMLFDLRDSNDFEGGHIPGSALAVCNEETKKTIMPRLPKNMEIILVEEEENYPKQMVEMMRQMGLQAKYLKDGILSWKGDLIKSADRDISPRDLKDMLDSEKSKQELFLLDVREPDEFKQWNITNSTNIPLNSLTNNKTLDTIPKDKRIVTICPHGNRSTVGKYILERFGYNVSSLEGGLKNWSSSFEIASEEFELDNSSNISLFQFRRIGKGCISYLLDSDGESIIIDPVYPIEKYIQKATELDTKIVKIIDTHQHADHVSAANALAEQTGAQHLQSAYEEYSDKAKSGTMIRDGDVMEIGKVKIKSIHTPGHTLGSMSLLVDNNISNNSDSSAKSIKILFTGDTIFVNGVGRPDLRDKAQEFASLLYDTIHNKILKLSGDIIVLPAHFETDIKSNEVLHTTLKEIKNNTMFLNPQISKEEFVKKISSKVMETPPNHTEIIAINKGEKSMPSSVSQVFDLEMGPNRCSIS